MKGSPAKNGDDIASPSGQGFVGNEFENNLPSRRFAGKILGEFFSVGGIFNPLCTATFSAKHYVVIAGYPS